MDAERTFQVGAVEVRITAAPAVRLPGGWFSPTVNMTDCNSPCWWAGETFYMLNSAADPWRTSGPDVAHLAPAVQVHYTSPADHYRWMESVHQEADGTLYGWYHNEPMQLIPEEVQQGRPNRLTAPRIGAAVSHDNGATWDDLGVVLECPADAYNYQTANFYFAGGNGDFSVILDRAGEYFYFLIGTYHRDPAEQGVSLARMPYAARAHPLGQVTKWHAGGWTEAGLGGRVTPVIPVQRDWHSPQPDAFWGPAVHYNHHIGQYVILLNRAVDPRWKQEGIYLSLAADIADPASWSEPLRILDAEGWYPQVVGSDVARRETDREAGETSRLFIGGVSQHEIHFRRLG